MEETVRFVFSNGIAKAAPQVNIVSGTPVTAGCRMVKSDHEIELMRLANKVTLTAYEAAYRALREGMTQSEFEELDWRGLRRAWVSPEKPACKWTNILRSRTVP